MNKTELIAHLLSCWNNTENWNEIPNEVLFVLSEINNKAKTKYTEFDINAIKKELNHKAICAFM